jgi:predicted Fe-Mo cluster-binding NifX family protein
MESFRLAAGTADGISVCGHLARSAAFLIFEIEDGRIAARGTRTRITDQCGNHRTFIEMLAGCRAVICGGIGQSAYDSLARNGIEPVVAAQPISAEDAVAQYLAGTLATTDERVCLCG